MVLTDGRHLVSTSSLEELHDFAAGIGLKREWFQDHRIPHYDLFGTAMVRKALSLGALKTTTRELVRCLSEWRRHGELVPARRFSREESPGGSDVLGLFCAARGYG